MTFVRIFLDSYLRPRRALMAVAQLENVRHGAGYALLRGLLLAVCFYLPLYLLRFEPITPAYLQAFDSPDYFLYATLYMPVFIVLSWIFLSGVSYVALRLPGYPADFDQILNVSGLLNLTIGVALIVFDWLMVAVQLHTNGYFMGIAHILIADPWSITLTAMYYRKQFGVPAWLSVAVGILLRILFLPLALVFVRT